MPAWNFRRPAAQIVPPRPNNWATSANQAAVAAAVAAALAATTAACRSSGVSMEAFERNEASAPLTPLSRLAASRVSTPRASAEPAEPTSKDRIAAGAAVAARHQLLRRRYPRLPEHAPVARIRRALRGGDSVPSSGQGRRRRRAERGHVRCMKTIGPGVVPAASSLLGVRVTTRRPVVALA